MGGLPIHASHYSVVNTFQIYGQISRNPPEENAYLDIFHMWRFIGEQNLVKQFDECLGSLAL